MKPQKSKHQLSDELSNQIENFLKTGGEVKQIPSGISGNTSNTNLFRTATQFEPKTDRTPLNEVVKALEERKTQKADKPLKQYKRPKKRLIVDDFGDPIRWVWDD